MQFNLSIISGFRTTLCKKFEVNNLKTSELKIKTVFELKIGVLRNFVIFASKVDF